uniref:Uncharacterized protein n=1 Tax=uncultured marine crenarchaeote HF4000_APKG8G15 TaxID=455605 RepID=B3TAQ9_9ARCH|nr:hypothetical protein ALOHA_HF4000APKG8G15ctg1g6 [uncultured marine crenarchaeote HF4000_APKG8G15]
MSSHHPCPDPELQQDPPFLFHQTLPYNHSGIEIVDSLPSSTLININLLSLKIRVTPPSLSGSSISKSGWPNRPSYFAMPSFQHSYLYP